MRSLLDDLRLTLRQLRRSPGFVVTAVLTLTLAIAANVVVFGVANGVLLHPLPVPKAASLVQVQGPGMMSMTVSYPNYRDVAQRTRSFESVAIDRLTRLALGVDGVAQPVWGYVASGNYWQTLGIEPELGRFFTPAQDVAVNANPVIVLSDLCWRLRFHADPAIVGKTIPVSKHPYTVIGVAPRGFHGTERFLWTDVWVPYHQGPELDEYDQFERRGATSSWVIARLKPGVSRAEADADLLRVSEQLSQEYPGDDKGMRLHVSTPGLIGDTLGKPVRGFVGGVMLLALLVLVAACANLGVLFSSRTADRARELGIRLAIGSSRGRILRQLVTEAVVIAVLGGMVASVLSTGLLRALSAWHPSSDLPAAMTVDADWTVYLFGMGVSLGTGLLFGMLPARQIWRTDPNQTMRASGSTAVSDRGTLRSGLLVVQIALCCLMVTASFVALRGLQRSFAVSMGFAPQGVTVATVDVHLAGYDGAAQAAVQERLVRAVAAIPGVAGAAFSNKLPLSASSNSNAIFAPGTTAFDTAHVRTSATVYEVSPAYFAVTETRLLAGRAFTPQDTKGTQAVAVVNETFAKKVFGTVNAVGKRYPTGEGHETEVVGVVEDGKYNYLAEDAEAAFFRPMLQVPDSEAVLFARSERNPSEMTVAVRKAIEGVDGAIPIFGVASWPDALGLATFPARAATIALGVMGALAVMLAVTGIFGVASYSVTRRMRELGIRVALGAATINVLRAALGRVLALLAVGSVAGLLLGFAATKLLASVVYHATAADPVVMLAVVLTMGLLGLGSAVVPARRAVRVDPAMLLREE